MTSSLVLAAAAKQTGSDSRLIIAALIGIAAIVVMITWLKVHPFLALLIGSIGVGIGAGEPINDAVTSFSNGTGSTVASVGLLIALGAMFAKLLADTGGADSVVDTIVNKASPRVLPWAMALVGAIIGLPMFFEIGLVLLVPVVLLVARRSGLSLMSLAIPTLAGLSAMHGLVPPHPGPLVAVAAFKANLGLTLALGVAVAIPTVIIAGPLFGKVAARAVDVPIPDLYGTGGDAEQLGVGGTSGGGGTGRGSGSTAVLEARTGTGTRTERDVRTQRDVQGDTRGQGGVRTWDRPRPSFGMALLAILLPVVLMLIRAAVDIAEPKSKGHVKAFFDFLGTPLVALAIAVVAGIFLLGRPAGFDRGRIDSSLVSSLAPIAGITFIVGAGGGFKQVLIDTGIANVVAKAIQGSHLSVLLLGWFVAVLIRVATGSATVAIVTASGILVPITNGLSSTHVSLMVLAVGSGSLFLSHVNDAGFWLVKEYLGLDVVQTLKSWSAMECIISVCGLGGVMALSAII